MHPQCTSAVGDGEEASDRSTDSLSPFKCPGLLESRKQPRNDREWNSSSWAQANRRSDDSVPISRGHAVHLTHVLRFANQGARFDVTPLAHKTSHKKHGNESECRRITGAGSGQARQFASHVRPRVGAVRAVPHISGPWLDADELTAVSIPFDYELCYMQPGSSLALQPVALRHTWEAAFRAASGVSMRKLGQSGGIIPPSKLLVGDFSISVASYRIPA